MKPVVFLGPSLAHKDAAAVLDATYHPPAAAGDVLTAARHGPPAIVVIDGYFARVPAVWHKEILYALDQGIPVYGASSMGALRAAELHGFGMIGVGSIFERYRDGTFEDDDEVAIRHVGEQFAFGAASEAMVNLRDGIAMAVVANIIDEADAALLVALGKAMFYPRRSWSTLAAAAVDAGLDEARVTQLVDFAKHHKPNTKRDDALAVLARVAADLAEPPQPAATPFMFERSIFLERLVESIGGHGAAGEQAAAVTASAKLHALGADWNVAMNRHLLRLDARRRERAAPPALLEAVVADLRRARGLADGGTFRRWLETNDIDQATLQRLAEDEIQKSAFLDAEFHGIEQALIDELKSRGAWAALSAASARETAAAGARGESGGDDEQQLIDWYARRFRPVTPDLAGHARALGFRNASEFLAAVARARLADEH